MVRTRRRKLGYVVLAVLSVLVLAETGLRAIWYYGQEPYLPDLRAVGEQYGDLIPNERKMFLVRDEMPYWWHTNGQGLRDEREFAVPAAAGTLRVLCVGDSLTFGPYLEGHDTYPAWLERYLKEATGGEVEVINAGVQGYTICDEYAYLAERGRKLRPDVVVLQACHNDAFGLRPEMQAYFCRGGAYCDRSSAAALTPHLWQRRLGRYFALVRAARDMRDSIAVRSAFASAEESALSGPTGDDRAYLFEEHFGEERARDAARYGGVFGAWVELVRELDVPCVVVLSPTLHRVRDLSLSSEIEREFEGLCERSGIVFVHPLEAFLRSGRAEELYLLPHDGHLSRYGCQVLARALAGPVLDVVK